MNRRAKDTTFLGRWRIVQTDLWDRDSLDLTGPAYITFSEDGLGELKLIAIEAFLDYRVVVRDGVQQVEFSWSGFEESDIVCGRGWARIDGDALSGQLFIHLGDDTMFVAAKDGVGPQE
ncbi:MAG: hypothetical protein ACC655_05170 [Rhodothermia bacterium]